MARSITRRRWARRRRDDADDWRLRDVLRPRLVVACARMCCRSLLPGLSGHSPPLANSRQIGEGKHRAGTKCWQWNNVGRLERRLLRGVVQIDPEIIIGVDFSVAVEVAVC